MEEIDLTNLKYMGSKVLEMKRDNEYIRFTSTGEVDLIEVESLQQMGRLRYKKKIGLKDACHEIVDSYVNGYAIIHNNLLYKGIYTALAVAKGKCDDKVNDEGNKTEV